MPQLLKPYEVRQRRGGSAAERRFERVKPQCCRARPVLTVSQLGRRQATSRGTSTNMPCTLCSNAASDEKPTAPQSGHLISLKQKDNGTTEMRILHQWNSCSLARPEDDLQPRSEYLAWGNELHQLT